jgi:hypothetical protein
MAERVVERMQWGGEPVAWGDQDANLLRVARPRLAPRAPYKPWENTANESPSTGLLGIARRNTGLV